jgi:hypothetical protein
MTKVPSRPSLDNQISEHGVDSVRQDSVISLVTIIVLDARLITRSCVGGSNEVDITGMAIVQLGPTTYFSVRRAVLE